MAFFFDLSASLLISIENVRFIPNLIQWWLNIAIRCKAGDVCKSLNIDCSDISMRFTS